MLNQNASDYLYFEAVKFIREVKKGSPFAETSPMLNDISALPSWSKTNSGMLKLYEGEVLRNLPAIQHMLFGSIFPPTWEFSVPPARSALPHPAVHHDVTLHAPNFDLPGATAKAPWADAEMLKKVSDDVHIPKSSD